MEVDQQEQEQSLELDARSEHLLRKAETILRNRTDRVLLVLERVLDNTNYLGALRTAEILGIQQVWVVQLPRGHAKAERQAQRAAAQKQKQGGQGQGSKGQQGQGGKRGRGHSSTQQEQVQGEGGAAGPSAAVAADVVTEGGAGQGEPQGLQGQSTGSLTVVDAGAAASAAQRRQRQRREEEEALRVQRAHEEGAGAGGGGGEEEGVEGEGEGEGVGTEELDDAAAAAAAGTSGLDDDKLRQEIRKRLRFSRASAQWLDVRFFWSIADCIAALKADGWTIWSTDLSAASQSLASPALQLPPKLALVMGREADGVSPQMLAASDARVYLPMFGFNGSFNVMVATGMALQAVLGRWPCVRGAMSDERRRALRLDWYAKLARSEAQRSLFSARALAAPVEPYADAPDLKDLHLMGPTGAANGAQNGAAGDGEGEGAAGAEEAAQ